MTDARAVNDAADMTLCMAPYEALEPSRSSKFPVRSILLDASLKRQHFLDPEHAPSELLSKVSASL